MIWAEDDHYDDYDVEAHSRQDTCSSSYFKKRWTGIKGLDGEI